MSSGAPNDPAGFPELPAKRSRLVVSMFTDLVDSTGLKSNLKTTGFLPLLERHDAILRGAIASGGGQVQQDTGDGAFAVFSTASDAVRAALIFQAGMNAEPWPGDRGLSARVGIHSGEVAETGVRQDGGGKLVGIAVDLTARVMSLARGGQILMTRTAFDDARQFVTAHPTGDASSLRYVAHGPYLLKGSDEPVDIFEVGVETRAPLAPPADSSNARRAIRPGEEQTLGWRPAVSLPLPGSPLWVLQAKLGEGGFGEVWLARHSKVKDRVRVFKFCFDPERLRALKREVVLFRLLKEALGDRRDIARVLEWQLEEAPYFIEMEYTPEGNVADWARGQGGIEAVPLGARLKIAAEVAVALSAAHGVGILHKDIKPSNVLMVRDADGSFFPRLTDFGIGILTDRDRLRDFNITAAGFTASNLTVNDSSRTGTRMYTPPEGLQDKPHTVQGDVYALGVMLYQMVVGDLNRPLGVGWERNVADPLIREDVAACVDEDPARRLPTAAALAERLASFDRRRAGQAKLARQAEALRASRRRNALLRLCGAALVVMAGVSVAFALLWRESVRQRNVASTERAKAVAAGDEARAAEARARRALAANLVERGSAYQASGDPSLALLYYARALELGGEDARAVNDRIRLRDALGRYWRPVQPFGGAARSARGVARVDSRVAADGRYLAAVGRVVYVCEADHRSTVASMEMDGDVSYCAFSADDSRVLCGAVDGTARVWTAHGLPASPTLVGDAPVRHVSLSPDGRRVVTASDDESAQIWDVEAGRQVCTPLRHQRPVKRASFSPDGKRVVTAGEDGTAQVWDAATGEKVGSPMRHNGAVGDARFSADGTRVVTFSNDTAYVWEAGSGLRSAPPLKHGFPVTAASFGPDGTRVVTTTQAQDDFDPTVRVWDADSGEEVAPPLPQPSRSLDASLADANGVVVVTGADFPDRIWDGAGDGAQAVSFGHAARVTDARFSPDGRCVATAGEDKVACVWDAASGQPLTPPMGHAGTVTCVAFSPDGGRIVTASEDKTARVWDAVTGQPLTPPSEQDGPVAWAEFSPDGARVVTAGADARVWDAATGKPVTPPLKHEGPVLHAAFSTDGKRVVTSAADASRVWDAASGAPLTPPIPAAGGYAPAGFSPDGRRLVVSDGYFAARVMDAVGGAPVTPKMPHAQLVRAARFSPDGKRVVTASQDKTARVWDAATGRPLTPPLKHAYSVADAAFSPDGTRIVTACDDRTVRVWDAASGLPLTGLLRTEHSAIRATFSPDGTRVLVVSADPAARAWDVGPTDRPAAYLVARAELASLRRIDEGGGLPSVGLEAFLATWNGLAAQYPQDFFPPPTPRLADGAIKSTQSSPALLAALGEWFARRGQIAGAITLLEAARQRGATVDAALLARCHWRAGSFDAAAVEFRRAIAAAADEAERKHLGLCLAAVTSAWAKAASPVK